VLSMRITFVDDELYPTLPRTGERDGWTLNDPTLDDPMSMRAKRAKILSVIRGVQGQTARSLLSVEKPRIPRSSLAALVFFPLVQLFRVCCCR
jgi:hypothetical protein